MQLGESLWPELPALGFDSYQDALDFANHCAEYSKRVASFDPRFCIIESYSEGKTVCVAEVSAAGTQDFDLVVFRDPLVLQKNDDAAKHDLKSLRRDWHQNGVLPQITKSVKTPESEIPSWVWLKCRDEGLDFIRRILGCSLDAVGQELRAFGENERREFIVPGPLLATDDA